MWTCWVKPGWRHPQEPDQQGVGYHPEGHAQRAIDQLRCKADQDEGQQCRKVDVQKVRHRIVSGDNILTISIEIDPRDTQSF